MKKVIIILSAVSLSLILILAALFYLSEAYPFHPGNILFGVQSAAENARVSLTRDPYQRTQMSFAVLERRLADLMMSRQSKSIVTAANAFDTSLSMAIRSIHSLPTEQAVMFYQKVDTILVQVDMILSGLSDQLDYQALILLQEKIAALQAATTPLEMQQIVAEPLQLPLPVTGKIISFLEADVDHGEFPMNGGHARLDCESCHVSGEYADTPSSCSSCHSVEREVASLPVELKLQATALQLSYPYHFEGECSDCHGVDNWLVKEFDHMAVVECSTCHSGDTPKVEQAMDNGLLSYVVWKFDLNPTEGSLRHYPGECMDCHQDTKSWEVASFDHYMSTCSNCHVYEDYTTATSANQVCMRLETCESCHVAENHEDNYPGACTNCHNDVEDWLTVKVDHTEYRNCYACHMDDKPVNHYQSQCSDCHTDTSWYEVYFDHEPDSNCRSCHTAPVNHYDEQCSVCHNMVDWKNSSFHQLATCSKCHTAPAGHYPGSCKSCHTTENWETADYGHMGAIACSVCHDSPTNHYDGECSNCHKSTTWDEVYFNHIGLNLCTDCHTAPSLHYPGVCTTCHVVQNWRIIVFNHTGYTNCTSCHSTPANHMPGVCTDCHITTEWNVIIYNHVENSICTNCHTAPTGHWSGQCSRCHVTSNWEMVNFDHTGYTDCKSCHARPTGHPRGQCSKCHTTDTWDIPSSDPVVTDEPPSAPVPGVPAPTEPPVVTAPAPTTETRVPPVVPIPTDTPAPSSATE